MTAMVPSRGLRRTILPLSVFVIVWVFHYVWLGYFPEQDPVQTRWVAIEGLIRTSWWQRYTEAQSYYTGFSYALALAFATVALRRYREDRSCGARNAAVGGISLSGFLAVAGCYLVGCCGSPMLAVYMSLFGASFLPLAKPLVAVLTTILIAVAWRWMDRGPGHVAPAKPLGPPEAYGQP